MDIRTALVQLIKLQEEITITEPKGLKIVKAYPYVPGRSSMIPDTPAYINDIQLPEIEQWIAGRNQVYIVRMQMLYDAADLDYAAEVCTSFLGATIAKFESNLTLNNTIATHTLFGGLPAVSPGTWAKKTFMVLDLNMRMVMPEAVTYAG